jgi:hypothetical protein
MNLSEPLAACPVENLPHRANIAGLMGSGNMAKLPMAEPLWWYSAAFFLATFGMMWIASLIDHRLYDGATLWAKPMKFALATAVHFITLAAVVHFLGLSWQNSHMLMIVAILSIIAAFGEVGYIAFQAARQQASHFNMGTPFYAAIYSLMAAGAVVLVMASGVVGWAAAVDGQSSFAMPTRIAVAIGLIGGTILTLITAFRLGGNMSHHIGVEPAAAMRMPLTGWSLQVGDLRPSHFFATHMMQAVPVFGVIATRILPATPAIIAVILFSLFWTGLTLGLFQIALSGRPLTALFGR